MRRSIFLFLLITGFSFSADAHVLNADNSQQQYDQWCWAACSKTILDYYGFSQQQCEIAEWVRTTATFHNFGSVNCCTDATQGCNYWNYNYSMKGSIQDILVHFGNLQSTGYGRALTQAEIQTEIQNNRLFVIRWGWLSGGGHFLVGYGINGSNVYYMNPWFGEGLKIGAYSYVLSGIGGAGNTDIHTWTNTNKLTGNLMSVAADPGEPSLHLYPNPASESVTLDGLPEDQKIRMEITDISGKVCLSRELVPVAGKTVVDVHLLSKGLYLLKLTSPAVSGAYKLVLR